MTARNIRNALIGIVAAALLLRIALIVVFKTYAHPEIWEFETIANHLLAGKGYSVRFLNNNYKSFATPLFGFLCAGIYAVTNHSFFAVLLIQSLFSIGLALTVFKIATIVFNPRVGLLATVLVAFHPGFLYYDVFNLLPLSIDSFLIAAITFLLLKNKERPTLKSMSLIGSLIGIAVLSRGITGVLLPLVIIYFVFVRSAHRIYRLKIIACVLCGTFLVLAPWLIRNYIVHKQFVLIASTSGENFWRGNNLYATGTSYDQKQTEIFELWPQTFKEKVLAMNELQQQQFFEREALSFIRANPGIAASLYAKKVYYFWWFSPQSGTIYPKNYMAVYRVYYIVIVSFFIVGLIFALAFSNRDVLKSSLILICFSICICLGQSLFYVEGRHRWLIEPLMIIFFSYGVAESWRRLRQNVPSLARSWN
jgi:4-amino-4-deoxy-L-arabinose transferase-like glycosyltransferase